MQHSTKDDGNAAAPDWVTIGVHYRAGIKTIRQISTEFGIPSSTLHKVAKREGWERDLRAKIHAKAKAMVTRAAVSEEEVARKTTTERVVVEANVQAIYQVCIGQKHRISRQKIVSEKLLDKLEAAVDLMPDIAEVIDIARQPDERGIDRLNDMMRKAMERSALIEDLKRLAEVEEKIRKGEREVFGIRNEDAGESEVDSLLKKVNAEAAGVVT